MESEQTVLREFFFDFAAYFQFCLHDNKKVKNIQKNNVPENFETIFDESYQKASNKPDLNHFDFLLPSHRSVITETAS